MSNNRKRRRPSWREDLPNFLDASASISAAMFAARRLPEIKDLWNRVRDDCLSGATVIDETFRSGGGKTSNRHLRRRTTCYNPRRRHRHPRGKPALEDGGNRPAKKSRKAKRRPRLMRKEHSGWRGDRTSPEKVFWMTTHLWHAKRFHMSTMFGWRVPLIHTNRGARAVHRLVRERKTLIQDTSWRMQPLLITLTDTDCAENSLQRLCPEFGLRKGRAFGEGVAHAIDSFPCDAIGPLKWWVKSCEEEKSTILVLFVHPATTDQMTEALAQIAETDSSGLELPKSFDEGLCCFQLRGTFATASLQAIATELPQSAHTAEHLDVLDFSLSIGTVQNTEESTNALIPQRSAFALRQRPLNDHENNDNWGVCGWDVLCNPSVGNDVFQALVMHGCVAIGLVEESHCRMECNAPLRSFPSDFPDTAAGQAYWAADDGPWTAVRSSVESGWGRTQIKKSKALPNRGDWETVASLPKAQPSTGPVTTRAVVVRGSFGQPFVEAISTLAAQMQWRQATQPKAQCKRRRATKNGFVVVPGLSLKESNGHQEQCTALLQNLSLAALLQCHLQARGKGTLAPGDKILGVGTNDTVQIGIVSAGSFSPQRGVSHGVGFVGAARLLRFLCSCRPTVMTWSTAQDTVWLQVYVESTGGGRYECALSLLI